MVRGLLPLMFFAWLIATPAVPALAQTAGPEAMAEYLRVVGGIGLTPAERKAVVDEQKKLAAREPQRRKEWSAAAGAVASYSKATAEDQAAARHRWRAGFHFIGKDNPAAYAIVARRDPVLIEDRAKKEVVSRADYDALLASNAFMGRLAKVAPPDGAITSSGIAELRQAYARDAGLRAALTQAQIRYRLSQRLWAAFKPADRQRVTEIVQAKVKTSAMVADAARDFENECVAGYVTAMRKRGDPIDRAIQVHAITSDYFGFMRGMAHMKF